MEWFIYIGAGAASGFLAGLFGVGGGMLIVPALLAALPLAGVDSPEQMKIAIATTLAIIVPTAIASSRAHAERNAIDYRALARFAPGVIGGAIGGVWLAAAIDVHLVTALFIVFMTRAALSMIFTRRSGPASDGAPLPGVIGLSAKGAGVGALSCLLGVGGGTLLMPILSRHMPLPRAIGTSALIGLILSVAAAVGYGLADAPAGCGRGCAGYIYLPAVGAMGVAAVLTAPLGAKAAHMLPVAALKRAFGVLLLVILFGLAQKTPLGIGVAAVAQALLEKQEPAVSIVEKSDRRHPEPASLEGRAAATRLAAVVDAKSSPQSESSEEILPLTPWPLAVLAPDQSITAEGEPLYAPQPTSGRTADAPTPVWLGAPWLEFMLASG